MRLVYTADVMASRPALETINFLWENDGRLSIGVGGREKEVGSVG